MEKLAENLISYENPGKVEIEAVDSSSRTGTSSSITLKEAEPLVRTLSNSSYTRLKFQ